jgi:formate dehydrogenase subunit gamma
MTESNTDEVLIESLIGRHKSTPGGLLPLLHAIQDECGYIPQQSVVAIAQALNLSRAEVHGVISYYHHFETGPHGRHHVEVCRAEACQARGSKALESHVRKRLGCDFGEDSQDGTHALREVYCLGLCATGPAVMIDGRPHSRVSDEKFDRLMEQVE